MLNTDNMLMSRRMCRWRRRKRFSWHGKTSSEKQMKMLYPKMKEKEFQFHRENEKVEKMNRSKGSAVNAIAVRRVLMRGSRGMKRVYPEKLKCP